MNSLPSKFFNIPFVIWPISVAILIFLLSFKMLNPQGFAASWGIANGFIFKSFISKFSSILNKLIFFSDIFSFCFGIASKVFWLTKTGIPNFFENVPSPWTWSECSCVIKIPSKDDGSISKLVSAVSIFLLLTPASTKMFVFSVFTNRLFPLLPLYKL